MDDKLTFEEYIDMLSGSGLDKEGFDALLKKKGIEYDMGDHTDYSYAVANGFRGDQSSFDRNKDTKYVSKVLSGSHNKINEIQSKIEKVDSILEEISNLPGSIKDYVNGELSLSSKSSKESKDRILSMIGSKSDKKHTHEILHIVGLAEKIKSIEDLIDEKVGADETEDALENFYTKDETYSKNEVQDEISNKIKKIRISGGGGGSIGNTFTGTSAQYVKGDGTYATLDKNAVGLGNVDNTSDATKNSAAVTLTNKTLTLPVFTNGAINFNAPQGFLINGQIVRTVASGNLTVAIKTLSGTDPSATDPVSIRIGNIVRTLTSALSTTHTAGTNWLNLGSAELATQEVDLFVYLQWNTVSSAVTILTSRMPYGRTRADFTYDQTVEKGLLIGVFNDTATDQVENIGRFNAILSAGAGYTWSLPATSVIVNRPIYDMRILNLSPQLSGDSGSGATATITFATYKISSDIMWISMRLVVTAKGTCSGVVYVSSAFTGVNNSSVLVGGIYANNTGPNTSKGRPGVFQNKIFFTKASQNSNTLWSDIVVGDEILISGQYRI